MYTFVSTRFDILNVVMKELWFDLLPTSIPISVLKFPEFFSLYFI